MLCCRGFEIKLFKMHVFNLTGYSSGKIVKNKVCETVTSRDCDVINVGCCHAKMTDVVPHRKHLLHNLTIKRLTNIEMYRMDCVFAFYYGYDLF